MSDEIMITEDDVIDGILEHLADAVEEGDWFEINPKSAALLLAHIEALEMVDAPVCLHLGRELGNKCSVCGYGPCEASTHLG